MTDPAFRLRAGESGELVQGTEGNVLTFQPDGSVAGEPLPTPPPGGGGGMICWFTSDAGEPADTFVVPLGIGGHSSEARCQYVQPVDVTAHALSATHTLSGGPGADVTAELRVNGVGTGHTVTIPSGGNTGSALFTLAIAAGAKLSLQLLTETEGNTGDTIGFALLG